MIDPRLDRLADLLVNYCTEVKPNEWVVISANVVALPLVEAVQKYVLRAGGHPTPWLNSDRLEETYLQEASDTQLQWASPLIESVGEKANVFINIRAHGNTRALSSIDAQRLQFSRQAQREPMKRFMERMMRDEIRWTITQYPCDSAAQESEMSLSAYEEFVFGATFADQPDPVAYWRNIHDNQQKIVDWLKGKKRIEIRAKNAELSMSIEGRSFINSDGKHNMPSGEVFTSPVEDSMTGWVKFDYPAVRDGRVVEGIYIEYENGRVVKASAERNEDYLLSQLDLDESARIVGEWAIGTNYGIQRFTKNILFDEKIGGTMHIAVGSGFPEAGGKNVSMLHWDMICGMQTDSEIWVDGDLLYKDGKFQIG